MSDDAPDDANWRNNEAVMGGPIGQWQLGHWINAAHELDNAITEWRVIANAPAYDFEGRGICAEGYIEEENAKAYYRHAAHSFVVAGAISTLLETLCYRAG